jgi:multidrug efflux pump subunit AcrA (membrane-fusion protein)
LRAPADGSLHCERPDYTGVWVPAGATLCHVVPEPARAEVIAELAEQDHAGVHPGQAVSLRVLALPWLRHGVLPGRVAGIAPDTRPPPVPGGAPVYLVTVSPEPGHALAAELAPGMRVEVDFHRGREPLWRWLLSPLAEGWLRAGREP